MQQHSWQDIILLQSRIDRNRKNLRSGDFVVLSATGEVVFTARTGRNQQACFITASGTIRWEWAYKDYSNLLPSGLTLEGLALVGIKGVGGMLETVPAELHPGYLLHTKVRPMLVAGALDAGMAAFVVAGHDSGRPYDYLVQSNRTVDLIPPDLIIGYWPSTKFEVIEVIPKEHWY